MTTFAHLRGLNSRTWRTATWLAPLTTQVVLALLIVTSWLLGKWFPGTGPVPLLLVSAAAVLSLCVVAVIVLARSATSRAQGVALSIAGAYTVVLVGAAAYGVWILRW
ncbi:hypothetical protein HZU38_11610 [Mycolicibacterium vanbaalenii]|jgi:hypothetical protein|uniref:hypothetical protein n=1 Tax=Mycolicibacterium vanbaalenii TaxID=110539 RepID=UPI001F36DC9D|nr:hypothetical protein [Mycolicibacterium vanbaalenii]UJL30994.1 hypothetical protein HZU38_11610 [Mycolicibacterium vanbaalenii]WND57821.1 hypothetical protein QQA43_05225 [Mycolicibacterium vanbaalenii]